MNSNETHNVKVNKTESLDRLPSRPVAREKTQTDQEWKLDLWTNLWKHFRLAFPTLYGGFEGEIGAKS